LHQPPNGRKFELQPLFLPEFAESFTKNCFLLERFDKAGLAWYHDAGFYGKLGFAAGKRRRRMGEEI